MRPPKSASTRDKILFHLKTKGPQTAGRLAERLGITTMAVRQQLARLEDEGAVDHEDEAGRVGRPRRSWRLTTRSQGEFPDAHADLAVDLLMAMRSSFGDDGMKRLIERRTEVQAAAYRERMPRASAPLAEKVSALASIRREEGYLAEWSRCSDGSLRLVENHCPICVAARGCLGLCDAELELFRAVLGPKTEIERTEYMLDGDRRCSYSIRTR